MEEYPRFVYAKDKDGNQLMFQLDASGRAIKGSSAMQTATIANGAKLSGEIDLGAPFENALVIMPDLTTDATAAVQVAEKTGGTFVTLYGLHLATPGDIAVPKSKASIVPIGGAQYLKISCTTNQGAERTIYVRGI